MGPGRQVLGASPRCRSMKLVISTREKSRTSTGQALDLLPLPIGLRERNGLVSPSVKPDLAPKLQAASPRSSQWARKDSNLRLRSRAGFTDRTLSRSGHAPMLSSLRPSRLPVTEGSLPFLLGASPSVPSLRLSSLLHARDVEGFLTRLFRVDPPGIEPGSGYVLETPCTGVARLSEQFVLAAIYGRSSPHCGCPFTPRAAAAWMMRMQHPRRVLVRPALPRVRPRGPRTRRRCCSLRCRL